MEGGGFVRGGVETKKLHSGALPKIMWGLGCHCIWTFERKNQCNGRQNVCLQIVACSSLLSLAGNLGKWVSAQGQAEACVA